jgi:hypothetical protein
MAGRVVSLLGSPRFNFWGALVSVAAEIISWTSAFPPGWKWATPAAFCLTVFFLGRLAWTQYLEAQGHRERAAPKFEIVFRPDQGRPYLQAKAFQNIRPMVGPIQMEDRRYRVGIVSRSTAIIPSVRLILVRCQPSGNYIEIGQRLAVYDSGNPPKGEADLHPNAHREPTLFFEVVFEFYEASELAADNFRFAYANYEQALPIRVDFDNPDMRHEITIRAEGGGWSDERTFIIEKPWSDEWTCSTKLEMKPV